MCVYQISAICGSINKCALVCKCCVFVYVRAGDECMRVCMQVFMCANVYVCTYMYM